MAFGEVYTALQTGVLDGFEHSPPVVFTGKYYEVAKYVDADRPPVRTDGDRLFDARMAELHG